MASGQVVRPEHCGPLALTRVCVQLLQALPPSLRTIRYVQHPDEARAFYVQADLGSGLPSSSGRRTPAAPTRRGRWPSPRRPPGSSPTPLSASTPDGPTPARWRAWTPGGGPPRSPTPGSPPTSARSSRRAARAESAGSARQRRPDHSVLLRYQKASRERGGIRQRGRANSVAERVTLCKRTHQINEPIIRERCDDDLLNELR